jgi:hypothetical protein
MSKRSSDPIGTLSAGNVVSTAVTLYKSNFRDYFLQSLKSVGWLFLGLLGLGLPLGLGAVAVSNSVLVVPTVLASLAWLVLFGFCLGKSAVHRAIISRLAYQQLLNQPETVAESSRQLAPKHWKFMRLSLWLGLFLTGIYLGCYVIFLILMGAGLFLAIKLNNILGGLLFVTFLLAGIALFIWSMVRFYSYWFVAELPLAVEERIAPLDSMGRSRKLSSPFVWRIQLIIFLAFLVTLPLNTLVNIPVTIFSGGPINQLEQAAKNPELMPAALTSYGILIVASTLLGMLLELFLIPFWQSIKSVVFFDLKSRREGADLQMR